MILSFNIIKYCLTRKNISLITNLYVSPDVIRTPPLLSHLNTSRPMFANEVQPGDNIYASMSEHTMRF